LFLSFPEGNPRHALPLTGVAGLSALVFVIPEGNLRFALPLTDVVACARFILSFPKGIRVSGGGYIHGKPL
jgi:hypothetical protein